MVLTAKQIKLAKIQRVINLLREADLLQQELIDDIALSKEYFDQLGDMVAYFEDFIEAEKEHDG
jgi:hypothetical protein